MLHRFDLAVLGQRGPEREQLLGFDGLVVAGAEDVVQFVIPVERFKSE